MIVTSEGDYSTMMVCAEYHYMSLYMYLCCMFLFFYGQCHTPGSQALMGFKDPVFLFSPLPLPYSYVQCITRTFFPFPVPGTCTFPFPFPCSWYMYLPIPIPLSWYLYLPIPTPPGWMYILEKHEGRLPLRIKAVPEGTVVPYKNGESELSLL